jgi:hypothetical protein
MRRILLVAMARKLIVSLWRSKTVRAMRSNMARAAIPIPENGTVPPPRVPDPQRSRAPDRGRTGRFGGHTGTATLVSGANPVPPKRSACDAPDYDQGFEAMLWLPKGSALWAPGRCASRTGSVHGSRTPISNCCWTKTLGSPDRDAVT